MTRAYDAAGNRTDAGSYGSGDRIIAFGDCSYQTDYDGNITSRSCPGQTTTFYWAADGRLDSLAVNGARRRYAYDPLGRLTRVDTSGVASSWLLRNDGDVLAELGGGANSKVAEYSYYGTDALHAVIIGSTPY